MTFNFFHFWKDSRFFTSTSKPTIKPLSQTTFFLGLKIIPSVFASSFNPSIILVKNLRRFPFFGFHEVSGWCVAGWQQAAKQCSLHSQPFFTWFFAPHEIRQTAQVINTHGTAWNQFCALNTKAFFPIFQDLFCCLAIFMGSRFS